MTVDCLMALISWTFDTIKKSLTVDDGSKLTFFDFSLGYATILLTGGSGTCILSDRIFQFELSTKRSREPNLTQRST